jgi:inhibitor of KinA sporulation pathway (predicted exonuclease)
MEHFIIFDCEWLTDEGAWERSNCGPNDPDPQIVQIGAVKVVLDQEMTIVQRFDQYIQPRKRNGAFWDIPRYFSDFTGITKDVIEKEGKELVDVINDFSSFSKDCKALWSWGNDELSIAQSCYLTGINFPLSAVLFGNMSKVFLKSGMPLTDILKTSSGKLSQYFRVSLENHREHNALCDVLSIHGALKFLYQSGKMETDWLVKPV